MSWTIYRLEENIGENICYLGLSRHFLDTIWEAQFIVEKKKIDKLNCIGTFALCMTWLKELKDIDYELGEIFEITYVMKDLYPVYINTLRRK